MKKVKMWRWVDLRPSGDITAAERSGDNFNPNLHRLWRADFHFFYHQCLSSSISHSSYIFIYLFIYEHEYKKFINLSGKIMEILKQRCGKFLPLQVMTLGVLMEEDDIWIQKMKMDEEIHFPV